MGQTENKTEESFLDIFELDHSKYDSDESSVTEMEEEVVTEGHGGAENAIEEDDEESVANYEEEEKAQGNRPR